LKRPSLVSLPDLTALIRTYQNKDVVMQLKFVFKIFRFFSKCNLDNSVFKIKPFIMTHEGSE